MFLEIIVPFFPHFFSIEMGKCFPKCVCVCDANVYMYAHNCLYKTMLFGVHFSCPCSPLPRSPYKVCKASSLVIVYTVIASRCPLTANTTYTD